MAFLGRKFARYVFIERSADLGSSWDPSANPLMCVLADYDKGEVISQLAPIDAEAYPDPVPNEGGNLGYQISDLGFDCRASSEGIWSYTQAAFDTPVSELYYTPYGLPSRYVISPNPANDIRYCAAPGMTLVVDAGSILTFAPGDQLRFGQIMDDADLPSPVGVTRWHDPDDEELIDLSQVGYIVEGEHAGKYVVSIRVVNEDVARARVVSEPFLPGDRIEIRQELFQLAYDPDTGVSPNGSELVAAYPQSSIMLTAAYQRGEF